ncbi:MAG: heavy metal-binding domain-containing protein [Ferruginibacter sp.]
MKKNQNELLLHSGKQGLRENMNSGTYTCSMHPEVKSDKPGKCPKCGMELVKKD